MSNKTWGHICAKLNDLLVKCAEKLPASQKAEDARCEASKAFSRYIDAKGKSDEEYEAMTDCMCCMATLLADNENLRKEREELKERLKSN